MSNRSWFYAANGQQQGPYPEDQLRDLIARGAVRSDTLVWTEGMSGWQQAGEIPSLMAGGSAPPSIPRPGAPPIGAGGYAGGGYGGGGGGALSIDLPLLPLLGRGLLMVIGMILVIPAPWTATSFYRWIVSRMTAPGRPDLGFTGRPLDIWYVFIVMGLMNYVGIYDNTLQLIGIVVSAFLSWMLTRWIIGNLSSNGQKLPIAFNGSWLTYVGWQLLTYVSFITIIGWAWVLTAWMRWICRNIDGTRREVTFNGTGLETLWRTILFVIGCAFVIPIPWVVRWYVRWFFSQFALVERTA